ncbi:MAG: TIGR03663 family protein [Acidobacteriota bacterium]|nr:TIGR03663 family protein [Acidobacteriota bacterium]
MNKTVCRGLFLVALIAAAGLRFGRLDLRPMHHDEANQAVKFGALLESGQYAYDKADHHGPTLYYLTLPAAWARGQKTLAALDETTLRIVPALFGLGLIALFLFLTRAIGRGAAAGAAFFAALSPALTYYSRSYIQETLFAFFAWGFLIALGWLFVKPSGGKAVAAGVLAGLAYATKETSVLVFAAAAAGLLIAWISSRPGSPGRRRLPSPVHGLAGLAAAAATAYLFFSSFFKNPRGIIDSLTAFKDYAARGTEAGLHSQPWNYYLKILAGTRSEGIFWTEAVILGLALAGAAAACLGFKKGTTLPEEYAGPDAWSRVFWLRYLAATTILLSVIFSALAYKTPWNMVPFLAGFAVLAGIGADALLRAIRPQTARAAVAVLLLAGAALLVRQNLMANIRYPADPRNPYVYAQTSPDYMRLVDRIRDVADFHRDGKAMLVKVIADPGEQWPLPWYLRDFTRVGYWTGLAEAGEMTGTPVVVASQEYAEIIEAAAGDSFQAAFYGLRPEVVQTLFIDRELWEGFLKSRMTGPRKVLKP